MSKRAGFAALVALLLLGIMSLGGGAGAPVAQAQGDAPTDEPFDVYVELEGVVVAIAPELLTLDDGLTIVLTSNTFIAPEVAPGVAVTVIARVVDDSFVADAVYPDADGPEQLQLSLAFVGCVDSQVGVHFVLLNVPDGMTPGNLDFTYGAGIPPQNVAGGIWHYWAYLPSGAYDITEASVAVNGQVVALSNPSAFAGEFDCMATPEPTQEPTLEPTLEPTAEPTQTPDCVGADPHPVGMRLADAFDVSYDEIMAWHCQGIGFGEIARAYALEYLSAEDDEPLTVEGLFDRRFAGEGWGNIVKDSGIAPNELAPGQVKRFGGDDDDGDDAANPVVEQQTDQDRDQDRDQDQDRDDDGPGNSENAPGQNKDRDNNGSGNDRNNNTNNNNTNNSNNRSNNNNRGGRGSR
ncbi:MAG: hypothetical protein IT323_00155 [Anaerolineae bacterium]|nr:hypothetical protein [Anaerolineae bacterium]